MSKVYLPKSFRFNVSKIEISTWIDHIHFAYDLVASIRPKLVVELGTYSGLSYFTFCQAMEENEITGVLYGIDTWIGDEHAGEAGEAMFQQVSNYSRKHYRGTSNLIRSTFSEALPQFGDESIDLLHIDGLHSYEAVKSDFESWLPKMKEGGVILLHDTTARLPGFGVWKFWEELSSEYTTFNFTHGYGLGVVQMPGGTRQRSELETIMFEGTEEEKNRLQELFIYVGQYHDLSRRVKNLEQKFLNPSSESSKSE